MKPAPFKYHSPSTLNEALELVATLENAKLLAGGQSLMPMMNFRFVMPDHIIDLNRIGELAAIEQRGDQLFFGAMTRQHALETSPVVQKLAPLIVEAYSHVSHRQVRNRGTYGGSLCHLDPSSEQPCFTSAMDGVIEVASRNGTRQVPMAEWTSMYMTPALAEDEMMTGAQLAVWPAEHGWAFAEYSRRHGDCRRRGIGHRGCSTPYRPIGNFDLRHRRRSGPARRRRIGIDRDGSRRRRDRTCDADCRLDRRRDGGCA
jgi:carbon-monoxide dehydrogenase medium subunit